MVDHSVQYNSISEIFIASSPGFAQIHHNQLDFFSGQPVQLDAPVRGASRPRPLQDRQNGQGRRVLGPEDAVGEAAGRGQTSEKDSAADGDKRCGWTGAFELKRTIFLKRHNLLWRNYIFQEPSS